MRLNVHCHVREMVLNAFKSEIFAIAPVEGTERPADLAACLKILTSTFLKTLTPKQMLQRLPVALAQVKAGNIYQNLLNEICQIVYSLFQEYGITKKVYSNS